MKRPKTSKGRTMLAGSRREVIRQAPHRIVGQLCLDAAMSNGPIEHESAIERLALLTFAFCRDVRRVATQQHQAVNAGSRQSHYADVLIELESGEELIVECKSQELAFRPDLMEELRQLGNAYRLSHRSFSILIDSQLRIEPQCKSVELLRRYLHVPVPPDFAAETLRTLSTGERQIGELAQHSSTPHALPYLYALIAKRVLCIDWDKPLDAQAGISLPDQPFEGLDHAKVINAGRFAPLLRELALGREPTNQRLLAAARSRDRSTPARSPWACCAGMPPAAYVGRGRSPGGLLAPSGSADNESACAEIGSQHGSGDLT